MYTQETLVQNVSPSRNVHQEINSKLNGIPTDVRNSMKSSRVEQKKVTTQTVASEIINNPQEDFQTLLQQLSNFNRTAFDLMEQEGCNRRH